MEACLLHGLIIFLNAFSMGMGELTGLFERKSFEAFRLCLITEGVSLNNIVERDNSESYNQLNYQWQLKPPSITPLAFVLVQNEREVVLVVSCATKWKVHLMPKGGGHSLEKYSFGDSNSVVVDLRNLNTFKIHKSKKAVTVGSGWLLGPLAYELWKAAQLIIPTTTCPTVGVAGLATGGGYSFIARTVGLLADNILSAKIVTANGTLLTANEKKNPDLYWALRGGVASNFGILVRLKLKTYPTFPLFLYVSFTYDMDQFYAVFSAWQKWAHVAPKSITPELGMVAGKVTLNFVDTTGEASNLEETIKKFPKPATKSMVAHPYPASYELLFRNLSGERLTQNIKSFPDFANLNRESPQELYEKRKSFYVTKKIKSAQVRKLKSALEGMPTTVSAYFESYGGAINDVPENGTAFPHRGETRYNFVMQHKNYVKNATADVVGTRWVEQFYEISMEIFDHKQTYQNYVEGDLQNYLDRYFGSNLPRLVQIKRNYDPENYWRNPQSIPIRL